MKKDIGFYGIVQEYFETRILYGYYAYGDSLPSIQKLCVIFDMAPATIRSALGQLEKKGYIKVNARTGSQVIYKTTPDRIREDAARYFVDRKDGIADLFQTVEVLFKPMWDTRIIMHNNLAQNLYWEFIRYLRFPYLMDIEKQEMISRNLKKRSVSDIISYLVCEFGDSYRPAAKRILTFIEEASLEYSQEDDRQIPFQWHIYRQRPQVRYTLASRIMRRIISGQYPLGTFLPSLPRLAEQEQVSMNTVRRTLDILESLGITRSFQGKGTLVLSEPGEIDMEKAEIQDGMRLFEDSMELLEATIHPVSIYTLEAAGLHKRKRLAQRLERLDEENTSYVCFEAYLSFIERECPSGMIRECYSKLRELLVWGYPAAAIRAREKGLHEKYRGVIMQMAECLRQDEMKAFADIWVNLLRYEIAQSCPTIEQCGSADTKKVLK